MSQHSKRYREGAAKVESRVYALDEAVALLQSMPRAKFDQSVELHMNLGIDPRQSDQIVRGAISLPAGIGAARRVICFADGEAAEKAKAAGAVEAGGDDLVAKVQGGWLDFDVAIAHPAMMPKVGKLGRVLGPQGKMPSPKAGTVVPDVVTAVKEFAAGKVEYRNDDTGNIHALVGKLSFDASALKQNIEAFVEHIRRSRPVAAKGIFIRTVTLTATMMPGIRLSM
ncbi:MAG TPA: 50S ribosomal protein L1 [Phycisphaerae bacterium]|nr:50S ribosomal protein L1 [Phycisphaerae bacterium]HOI55802.1 50S ribosomal protein L1 [Phycisphaerae bacterium]